MSCTYFAKRICLSLDQNKSLGFQWGVRRPANLFGNSLSIYIFHQQWPWMDKPQLSRKWSITQPAARWSWLMKIPARKKKKKWGRDCQGVWLRCAAQEVVRTKAAFHQQQHQFKGLVMFGRWPILCLSLTPVVGLSCNTSFHVKLWSRPFLSLRWTSLSRFDFKIWRSVFFFYPFKQADVRVLRVVIEYPCHHPPGK